MWTFKPSDSVAGRHQNRKCSGRKEEETTQQSQFCPSSLSGFVLYKITNSVVIKDKTKLVNIPLPQRVAFSCIFIKLKHIVCYVSVRKKQTSTFTFTLFAKYVFVLSFKEVFHLGCKAGRLSVAMMTATSWFQENVEGVSIFTYPPPFIRRSLPEL